MKIEQNSPAAATPDIKAKLTATSRKPENQPQPSDSAGVSALTSQVLTSSEARVDELKKIYESGKYSVPAEEIAKSIVRESGKE